MIYNDKFIWLHFPKCGGAKIEIIFKKYFSDIEGLIQEHPTNNLTQATWHDSITDREKNNSGFKVDNRDIICSFRKLPAWLKSRYNYEYKRSPHLNHNYKLLLEGKFLERNGNIINADYYAKKYLPSSLLESNKIRFIRTEYFESDFKSIFGDYLDISVIPNSEYKEKYNKSENFLPDLFMKELQGEEKYLYNKCPHWKKIEKLAYNR